MSARVRVGDTLTLSDGKVVAFGPSGARKFNVALDLLEEDPTWEQSLDGLLTLHEPGQEEGRLGPIIVKRIDLVELVHAWQEQNADPSDGGAGVI